MRPLATFLVRRLVAMVGLLVVLAAVVFVLQRFTPADPVRVKLGPNASAAVLAAERHRLGYDRPISVQFFRYVQGVLHGDFGDSLRTQRPVATDLRVFLPATVELLVCIGLVTAIAGVLLGVVTSRRRGGAAPVRFGMATGASAPAFFLVLVCLLVFYRKLDLLPGSGQTSYLDAPSGPTGLLLVDSLVHGRPDVFLDALHHLILPTLAGALAPSVAIARVLRSSLTGVLTTDYVRTAHAKGLREWTVVRRHGLRNAAGPALSLAGLLVTSLFTGTLVVESLIAWPGLGNYTVKSIQSTDFPAIAGVTLLLGAIVIVVNTVIEVLQSVADPRITL